MDIDVLGLWLGDDWGIALEVIECVVSVDPCLDLWWLSPGRPEVDPPPGDDASYDGGRYFCARATGVRGRTISMRMGDVLGCGALGSLYTGNEPLGFFRSMLASSVGGEVNGTTMSSMRVLLPPPGVGTLGTGGGDGTVVPYGAVLPTTVFMYGTERALPVKCVWTGLVGGMSPLLPPFMGPPDKLV
jgi:hypothetical protein